MACGCSSVVLFIVTILTVGSSTGLFYYWTYLSYKYRDYDKGNAYIGYTAASVAGTFILMFSLYASCSDSRCIKVILSLIFALYIILFAVLIVICVSVESDFDEIGKKFYEDPYYQMWMESWLDCTKWSDKNSGDADDCAVALNNVIIVAFIFLGIFCFISLLGFIVSCSNICCPRKSKVPNINSSPLLDGNSPMNSGQQKIWF